MGSRILIRPYYGPGFKWEIVDVKLNEEVTVKYFDGLYSGIGIWQIEKVRDKTELTYKIELRDNSILIRSMGRFVDLQKLHSNMMKNVFFKLEKYLAKQNKI